MKKLLIIAEGISDYPSKKYDDKTPLELARTPNLNFITQNGMSGLCKPIPTSLYPGSDVGFLSILGNKPSKKGGSKGFFEARGLGLGYNDNEICFRVNLIPIEEEKMVAYGSSTITNDECTILANTLNKHFENIPIKFYPVSGYRLVMATNKKWLFEDKKDNLKTFPPIENKPAPVKDNYPKGNGSERLINIMEEASKLLSSHDINQIKIDFGENPANGIWIWGQQAPKNLTSFEKNYSERAFCIPSSHVIRGIALSLGMECAPVIGAHSNIWPSLSQRIDAAIQAAQLFDVVIIHIETINDVSQKGNLHKKCQSIESFDEKVVGALFNEIQKYNEYRMMVASSHITGYCDMIPTKAPVPWVICGTGIQPDSCCFFNEKAAAASKFGAIPGHKVLAKTLFKS